MNFDDVLIYIRKFSSFQEMGLLSYNKSLDKILYLCKLLNNPNTKFISIHVGGTNGKGSVCSMLSAILQSSGYKTGLYTSPYINNFKENIKINNTSIEEKYIIDFVKKYKNTLDKVMPSLFEFMTLLAFSYFADNKIQLAVIEVGLGGRFDATNIVNSIISIITNIRYDHVNILGNSLCQIAFEKVGIIRYKSNLIIGENNILKVNKVLFDYALLFQNKVYMAENIWHMQYHNNKYHFFSNWDKKYEYNIYTDINSPYQGKNIKTVITAIHILNQNGFFISKNNIEIGLNNVRLFTKFNCRWEFINNDPLTLLDIGHNVDGLKTIFDYLQLSTYNNIHVIIGLMKDKNIYDIMHILPKNRFIYYYCGIRNNKRSLDSRIMMKISIQLKLKGYCFETPLDAYKKSINNYNYKDLILIIGSTTIMDSIINFTR
ncbi:MAG: hypothetical protein IR527_00390 [Bacteroides sp.]|nr:MAG: hypothetical protein IR527_00390 [Bacteroides sp.]